ncbi:50S ribosomal protein L5 [Halarsenatibacter silvermanii]|uniref:Large ribosomal subunit protein uL5 n=1 Tax=Halarsenatibacter silvermanii TaxID=321763 RepID=A0A1G9NAJ2_9FIRM|nr:50S ribosomal protein L5 [Halarsenatibacter silvermanii]SDL83546.1 LSU ribosomal protein L5P [Halarsenatibacter silvermanii]
MSVLARQYKEEIRPALKEELNYDNVMETPELDKVIINVGLGDAKEDPKLLESVMGDITMIAGQQPTVTRAKKAIANFKIREGMPVGMKVTLRDKNMYEFVYRLINIALPRIRDFRGVSRDSFDGRGNYSIGIRDHTIFPEVDVEEVDQITGLQITIVTSAEDDEEGYQLLKKMGMPFND